jgi:hypothetical protein
MSTLRRRRLTPALENEILWAARGRETSAILQTGGVQHDYRERLAALNRLP